MAYIAGLVIVGFLILAIKYFLDLNRKQEIIAGVLIATLILGAIAFNAYSASQRESVLRAITKFKQNRTIICNSVEVNTTNYDLSEGTHTFIGRENTPFFGEMISASSCE